MKYDKEFWNVLDSLVSNSVIIIDRPKGSTHPKYADFTYEIDYGYLSDTTSLDNEGIDSAQKINGIICTVDLKKKDSEIKILIGCTDAEIQTVYETHNNTEFMKGILIMRS